ncbi:MAG: response regulator [Qipengyuania sp.]|nr:response regulator [Qipengyuania sp.]
MPRRRTRKAATNGLQLRRVLVVEDDPILGMATEDTLREGGVEHVDICPTTDGALEVLKAELPDAIVLDVHLSDRNDGWAIAELVESLGENSPRIVFSTGAPQDIPPHIAELGSVLTKPYAPEALLAALREPGRRGLLSRLRDAIG